MFGDRRHCALVRRWQQPGFEEMNLTCLLVLVFLSSGPIFGWVERQWVDVWNALGGRMAPLRRKAVSLPP